jgi:Uma2 family endonuclease
MTADVSPPELVTTVLSAPQIARVTIADLLSRLDDIPASRIRLHPFPGTATAHDVTHVLDHENVICELVEGTLVEKTMGLRESVLTMLLAQYLGAFVRTNKLGIISGPDGTMLLPPGFVRAPDIAFISRERLPAERVRKEPIPEVIPDLAIEILSESNTTAEMTRKRREYFAAGVRLVWIIDPRKRTAAIYTAADQNTVLSESGTLEGGAVVPGFELSLGRLFREIDEQLNGGSAD